MSNNEQNDDVLIQHLAAGHTVSQAAGAVALSTQTVYRRLRDPLFRAKLAEARAAVLQPVVARTMAEVGKSLDRLVAIRDDEDAAPSSRVRAAVAIIETALKLNNAVVVELRLASIEAALAEHGIESPTAPPPLTENS